MITRLINIHTTNAKIGYDITHGKLEYDAQPAENTTTRQKGGLEIHTVNSKLSLDNTDFHNSIGLKDTITFDKECVQKAQQKMKESIADIVKKGNLMAKPGGLDLAKYYQSKAIDRVETNIGFIPEHSKMSFSKAEQEIKYTPDKLNVQWNTNRNVEFNCTRDKFSLYSKQKAEVDIEYLGEPRYVPASYGTRKLDIKI